MTLVVTATSDDIGFITLNCAEKRNALSGRLVGAIIAALASCRVVYESDDDQEDTRAFKEKREPDCKGK